LSHRVFYNYYYIKNSETLRQKMKTHTIIFTAFNFDSLEEFIDDIQCDWAIGQLEKCPTTGKVHIQGMAWAKTQSRWGQLKKLCHIEKCFKPVDSIKYCTKEDTRVRGPYEKGKRPTFNVKGQKLKNMELLKMDVVEALKEDKISWKDASKFQYAKQLVSVAEAPKETENRGCYWLVGKSGSGKSRYVREKYPDCYLKMINKWFDGYMGEDVMLIEDVDKDHAKWLCYFLKIWSDRYKFRAEVKGGSILIPPFKHVYVTSNWTPSDRDWETT